MADVLNFPDRSRTQEEAGLWLVKLDSGELSPEQAAGFRGWLNSSRDNRDMIIELAVLWNNMSVLSELSDLFPLAKKSDNGIPTSTATKRFPFKRAAMTAVAAVLVLTLAVFTINLSEQEDFRGVVTDSVYATSVGEQAEIKLPDGSETNLNTDSEIKIAFNDDQRNIRLVKGEAHFNVAHDEHRPFVVHAGNGIIRAVGTAFSVHLKDQNVEVIVTEGTVEIASVKEPRHDSFIDLNDIAPHKFLTTISAGQSAEYGNENIYSVKQVEPEIISRKLSWQRGMLVFEGNMLEDVVEEISRYTDTEIIIRDPDIRDIRVGGYFRTGETEALLAVLENNFSINITRANDHLIYLSGPGIKQATNDPE